MTASRYVWRPVGRGKRVHAFFIRTDRTIALTAVCGVGPRNGFLNIEHCRSCEALVARDEATTAPTPENVPQEQEAGW